MKPVVYVNGRETDHGWLFSLAVDMRPSIDTPDDDPRRLRNGVSFLARSPAGYPIDGPPNDPRSVANRLRALADWIEQYAPKDAP